MSRFTITLLFLFVTLLADAQTKSSPINNHWKADSTEAVSRGIPLLVQSRGVSYTFMGFQNGLPQYCSPATLGEVESYLGDMLWAAPYALSGNGQTAGIWESFSGSSALPNASNDNLQTAGVAPSRILPQDAGSNSSHATNVALRIAGDGLGTSAHRGVASLLQIKAWDITNYASELSTNAIQLSASNHSYAYTCGYTNPIDGVNWFAEINVSSVEDFKFGRYSSIDKTLDSIAYLNPFHSLVIAAGNDRGTLQTGTITAYHTSDGITYTKPTVSPAPPKDGGADGFDCIPLGANGKNTITVGSCGFIPGGYSAAADVVVAAQSCFGPTDDGRIKPDFVAPATGGFTSYSTPQVTGSIALLQELSLRERGQMLRAATVKALLAHTAFEAGTNIGPDYKHGWGLINPTGAADVILGQSGKSHINESLLTDGAEEYFLIYCDGTTPITATLAWTDPEIAPLARTFGPSDLDNPAARLVNDLDMRLVDMNHTVLASPYILDPANPANAATTGDNARDNLEKILVSAPPAGWYALRINHKSTLPTAQEYSLIISGATSGNCAANSVPSVDNTWGATGWSFAFIDGQNVNIAEDITVSSHLIFGDALFNENVTITIEAGKTLTISGQVWSFENVIFDGDGTVILNGSTSQLWCGGATLNTIEVNNSSSVILDGNPISIDNYVDVQAGTLLAGGMLNLLSSPGKYAQIHESGGAISGDVSFQQTVTHQGWHNIASPVSTTLGDLVEDMDDYTFLANGGSIYRWDAANGAWAYPLDTTVVFDAKNPYNAFFGTSGSRVFSSIPFTIQLKGAVFSGPVNNDVFYGTSTAISNGSGWNLLANPYPENLDWNSIKANFGGLNINPGYAIFDANAGVYKTHDGTTGATELGGYIAPGQAFFVRLNNAAAEATTAFDFTNANRTLAQADFFKTDPSQIVLSAHQNGKTDDYFLAFTAEGSSEFNPALDAQKLFSPQQGVPQIFQPVDSATRLAIKYAPHQIKSVHIPIAYKNTAAGNAQISANFSSLKEDWPVFLEDLKLNKMHDLRSNSYSFTHEPQFKINRFILHIGAPNKSATQNQLAAWGSNGNLKISLVEPIENASISIYNVVGEKVFSEQCQTLKNIEIPFAQTGVFIVRVTTKNGDAWVEKVVN